MSRFWYVLALSIVSFGTIQADERDDLFETKIRPILVNTCFKCHGDAKVSGGFRVDTRENLLKGGDNGPAIVPGKPAESPLLKAIRRVENISAMPPEKSKALRPDETAAFEKWIAAGAVWPSKSKKFTATKHWAFEPIAKPALPKTKNDAWRKTSVDAFIQVRQEAAGVKHAAEADKRTLIRRATFDLTGLPPKPNEVEDFLNDHSPNAFEKVIDRLLKSPAYGERWGRHWLDVVRYADTAGDTADYPVPLAWRYRNYVIDAFNADKPYDEFLREQIAGDILAANGPREKYAERVIATGYLAISRRFGFDSENYHHLTIQDTIDTMGQSALGLSLGCARCHDHKFDAVTMKDYYALYSIFDSSRYAFPGSEQKQRMLSLSPLLPPSESRVKWAEFESRVAELTERLAKQKISAPATPLHSLHEMDGDFETQAPAAGGSNGVLVSPWLYQGKIAVTTDAQSPFRNLHPGGRIGASIAPGIGNYRIWQAPTARRTGDVVYANIDFRIKGAETGSIGAHRIFLGKQSGDQIASVTLTPGGVMLRTGECNETVAPLKFNQWQNLQLAINLKTRKISGQIGSPGNVVSFTDKPLGATSGDIELLQLDSVYPSEKSIGIDYDNIGVRDQPIAPVTTQTMIPKATGSDVVALADELQRLTGFGGDFESQSKNTPPSAPWNAGPNSVVKVSDQSQSPFRNIYAGGKLGIHMPNRGEYDGFGVALSHVKFDESGKLHVGFDFRCADDSKGGGGSWRYYLGHGAGNSAAVELFFNNREFFKRSGNDRVAVAPLKVGDWYQVRYVLDTKARTYSGTLQSAKSNVAFEGNVAAGWDGQIDHSFIDSYGHLPGVRPALDADNFVLRDKSLPTLEAPAVIADTSEKQARIASIRKQLDELRTKAEEDRKELARLVANGPFDMAYAMAEGTPHQVRMQLRGEPDRPGEPVQRGTIKILGGGALPDNTPGSGRLELAQWLTKPDHPLTARVMVNRIWQYHFGKGLVKTPNDFGVRGIPPTHPELLDHLATEFIRSGWSVKAVHRLIMLSATYRQASNTTGDAGDVYASFPRRRLSAEEIRDSILAVSGELDTVPGKDHPFPSPVSWGYSQHAPYIAVYEHDKRSVYLMTQRLKRHPFLALFDGPDPNATTADRLITTVPTQALFFLNDPFVHAKANKWAERLIKTGATDLDRVNMAWKQSLGRLPEEMERTNAIAFLVGYREELKSLGSKDLDTTALAAYLRTLFGGNEFLHVD